MPSIPARDTRLTVDDFMLFPDDGKRHEIIDGVHYVTPSPVTRHQAISGRLFLSLGNFLAEQPQLGRVFFAPFDVIFTRWDVVEPDLLVIAGDQLDILTTKNVQGAPAIVVEILSPGTRKVDESDQAAALRPRRRPRVLADRSRVGPREGLPPSADGTFPRVAELSREAEDTLTSDVLPGWSVALTRLLADD